MDSVTHVTIAISTIMAICAVKVTAKFYVTNGTGPPCPLGSPQITNITSQYKITVELPDHVHIKGGDQLRVGYKSTSAMFSYIGCYRVESLNATRYINASLRPETCYTFCKTDYVGISEPTCYCLKSRPIASEDHGAHNNSEQILENNGIVFSGKTGFAVIYYYVSTLEVSSSKRNYNCRVYNTSSASYGWESCFSVHHGMCTNGSTAQVSENTTDWQSYIHRCFDEELRPVVKEQAIRLPGNVTEELLWLGNIRYTTIIETKEWSNDSCTSNKQCGYLLVNNTTRKFEVSFTGQPIQRALCLEAPETSVTKTPGNRTAGLNELESPTAPTDEWLSPTIIIVIIIVSAVFGVVSIIAVTTACCVLHRNRKKSPRACENQTHTPATNQYSASTESGYVELADMGASGNAARQALASGSKQVLDNSDQNDDEFYDTAREIGAACPDAVMHIDDTDYSKLSEVVSDTYDSVVNGAQGQGRNILPENVYDHVAPPATANTNSGIYDHASTLANVPVEHSHVEDTGNVYEHVNMSTGTHKKKK